MGSPARIVGITASITLSIAALICFSLLFAAGSNNTLLSLNYVRLEIPTTTANANATILHPSLYEIFLFGYCTGDNGVIASCASRQSTFSWNPIDVLGPAFNNSLSTDAFNDMNSHVNDYHMAAIGACVLFYVAFALVIASLAIILPAILWETASVLVLFLASLAGFITLLWAIMTTVMFASLRLAFEITSPDYTPHASLGGAAFAITWLLVAFVVGAGCSWGVASCCGGRKKTSESRWEKVDGNSVSSGSASSGQSIEKKKKERKKIPRVPVNSWEYMTYSVPFYF